MHANPPTPTTTALRIALLLLLLLRCSLAAMATVRHATLHPDGTPIMPDGAPSPLSALLSDADFAVPPTTTTMLALPGPRYSLDAALNGLCVVASGSGRTDHLVVRVATRPNSGDGTAFTLWDGAFQLAKYLEAHPSLVRGKSVLELGAGCGLLGLVAATLGASRVTLTDLPHVGPHLLASAALNPHIPPGVVSVAALDWFAPAAFDTSEPVDVIVGADVVWVGDLIPPLVDTLARLAAAWPAARILLAHQTRSHSGDELLFRGLRERGLSVSRIPHGEHAPGYASRDIDLLRVEGSGVVEGGLPAVDEDVR